MSTLTLALAKTHLNITVDTYDTELQTIVDAAEAAIEKRCGPLVAVAVTSRVRGESEVLVLPRTPVLSLTSVTPVAGSALTVGDLLVNAGGVVEYVSGGTFGSRWYDVEYEVGHGEDAADVPDDLMFGVKELVRHFWETQRGRSAPGGPRAAESAANTIPGAAYLFPFRVEQAIASYVQPGFA